jgi:hypothetical protein
VLQSSDKVKNLEFCSHVPYIVLYYCTKEKVNKLQEHLIAVNKALSPGQCLLFRNGFFFIMPYIVGFVCRFSGLPNIMQVIMQVFNLLMTTFGPEL